jgi:CheY-like chemotaxis protein
MMADPMPRVLVVDDERFFREAICEALSEVGFECESAESGAAALAAARDPHVGVVILDIALEGMDGLELLRTLRSERPALRVIVLSTQTDQERVLEALRLEATDYLAKPLHDEELLLAVRRALLGYGIESSRERLREGLQRLEAQMSVLFGSGEPLDVGEVARRTASAVADVLEASKTSVMLYDEEKQELRVAAVTGSLLDASEMDPVVLGEGVAGMALALGQAVVVDDVYTDRRFEKRSPRERYASPSLAIAPLAYGGEPLGVLCATDRMDGTRFGDDDLALLKLLAHQASQLLVRVRSLAAVDPVAVAPPVGEGTTAPMLDDELPPRRNEDAELAREICDALTVEVEPSRVIEAALRPIARSLGASPVALYLIDNASGELVREGQVANEGVEDRPRLPRSQGLTATVLQTGGLVATERPERDPRFDPEVDTPANGEAGPLLCVPLRFRGKVLGVFRAFPRARTASSARTGEVLSAVLSAAVRNVLLYRSLLDAIDEVALARRDAEGKTRG